MGAEAFQADLLLCACNKKSWMLILSGVVIKFVLLSRAQ